MHTLHDYVHSNINMRGEVGNRPALMGLEIKREKDASICSFDLGINKGHQKLVTWDLTVTGLVRLPVSTR